MVVVTCVLVFNYKCLHEVRRDRRREVSQLLAPRVLRRPLAPCARGRWADDAAADAHRDKFAEKLFHFRLPFGSGVHKR